MPKPDSTQQPQPDRHAAEYDKHAASVCRVRDFLEGEFTVKGKSTAYLPVLAGQDTTEYESYRDRATFLNATARTHSGLIGQIFRKPPALAVPAAIQQMEADADLCGHTLETVARNVVSEALATGRCATLVEWSDEEGRPSMVTWVREDVLDWKVERVGGRMMLVRVGLQEPKRDDGVERVRELLLEGEGEARRYVVNVWALEAASAKSRRWVLEQGPVVPLRAGKPLTEIPFVFHDWQQEIAAPKPPLDDLVALNLSHYRTSADHKHGLHYTALPTAYVTGFPSNSVLKIGSSVAWVTENADASAGYLEFSGAGLGAIRAELDALEKSMAALGARLLESQKREAESAEALSLRQSGETSVLASVSKSVSASLTQALQWALWWATPSQSDRNVKECSVQLNTDFASSQMTGAELVAFVSAWQSGGISRATLHYNLTEGELLPPGTTMEKEVAAIMSDAVRSAPPADGEPDDGEDGDGDGTGGQGARGSSGGEE